MPATGADCCKHAQLRLQGLGLEYCRDLACRRGCQLLVTASRGGALPMHTFAELAAAGCAVLAAATNLGSAAAFQHVITWAREHLPPLEHFAHAAGVNDFGALQDMDVARLSAVTDVKVRNRLVQGKQTTAGYIATVQEGLPRMLLLLSRRRRRPPPPGAGPAPADDGSSCFPAGCPPPCLSFALFINVFGLEPKRCWGICSRERLPGCPCLCQPACWPSWDCHPIWALRGHWHGSDAR